MYGRRHPSASSSSAIRELGVRPRKPAMAPRCDGAAGDRELDGQGVDHFAEGHRRVLGQHLAELVRVSVSGHQPAAIVMCAFHLPSVAEDDAHEAATSG